MIDHVSVSLIEWEQSASNTFVSLDQWSQSLIYNVYRAQGTTKKGRQCVTLTSPRKKAAYLKEVCQFVLFTYAHGLHLWCVADLYLVESWLELFMSLADSNTIESNQIRTKSMQSYLEWRSRDNGK